MAAHLAGQAVQVRQTTHPAVGREGNFTVQAIASEIQETPASLTELPVLGVPIESKALKGMDSLLSIVQMPAGIPVGTLAIGEAGAKNAALLAVQIIARHDQRLAEVYRKFKADQAVAVKKKNAALQQTIKGAK